MKTKKFTVIISAIITILLLVLGACDKRVVEVAEHIIQNITAVPDSIYADSDDQTYAEIKATVTDKDGDPLVGEIVNFRIVEDSLGSITATATTGSNGVAKADFMDFGVLGIANIEAYIPSSKKEISVKIIDFPEFFIQNLIAFPDSIYADNDDQTYSQIKATVVDEGGNPVVGETVNFRTLEDTLGNITATAITGSNGVATASFMDFGLLGLANIEAYITNSSKQVTVKIVDQPLPDVYHIEWITANPDTIYADNNITYSDISVLVKDQDGFAVPGQSVRFRTNIGSIITTVSTDSSGIASTTFWDGGEQGNALIEAFVGDITASVNVQIEEVPPIETLLLDINNDEFEIDAVTLIRAAAYYPYGPVPNGTIIVFQTTEGHFQSDLQGTNLGSVSQSTTTNGTAEVYWNTGTQSGMAMVTAAISDQIATENIVINPGDPRYMTLYPSTSEVEAASNETVIIGAHVRDTHQNSVLNDVNVDFETTLGTIDIQAATDDSGWCFVEFSPGITAGLATISATADSAQAQTIINVTSDDVNSIEFDFSQQVEIQVGGQSFEVVVNLFDINGNMIDYMEDVWFRFLGGPDGTSLNGEITLPSSDSLSVESSNGRAIVSVSSGDVSGTVELEAFAYNDLGNRISIAKTNIVVHGGPPNSVDITHDDFNEGVSVGSGNWQIGVAAILNDQYGNPVPYGTAIYFSLPTDPSWAAIHAYAYVGNENADGDSLDGVAFTYLVYEGTHANDLLEIQVQSGDFIDSDIIVLPIQNPVIDISAYPAHVDWDEDNNPPDDISTLVTVRVIDGQQNAISNQEVYITGTLGDPENGDFIELTDEDGYIFKYWEFHRHECPPCVNDVPGQTTGTITAQLLGPGVQNNVTIILKRYCGNVLP